MVQPIVKSTGPRDRRTIAYVFKAQFSQQDVRLNQMSAALSAQDRKLDEIVKLLKSS